MGARRNAWLGWAWGMAASLLLGASLLPAKAQTNAFSGYSKENANKPIDIESDRLEVRDKQQLAIFSGNVSATQGDYNLKSKVLEVTYERSAAQQQGQSGGGKTKAPSKGTQPASASASAADPISSGQVKYIRAKGAVIVTSQKDEQTATGNEGFYDVKDQKITLTGDVTLVQKGNVIKGEKLAIDLATGQAVVDPVANGKPGRVRAILSRDGGSGDGPANLLSGGAKKKAKTPEKAPEEQKAPSGWQTQSR